jgi:hypothetical protein
MSESEFLLLVSCFAGGVFFGFVAWMIPALRLIRDLKEEIAKLKEWNSTKLDALGFEFGNQLTRDRTKPSASPTPPVEVDRDSASWRDRKWHDGPRDPLSGIKKG